MLHLIALACTSPEDEGPALTDDSVVAADDSSATDDSEDTEPVSYNGTVPDEKLPLTTFAVVNRDGARRTDADLRGKPTALWFYPAANTPG